MVQSQFNISVPKSLSLACLLWPSGIVEGIDIPKRRLYNVVYDIQNDIILAKKQAPSQARQIKPASLFMTIKRTPGLKESDLQMASNDNIDINLKVRSYV